MFLRPLSLRRFIIEGNVPSVVPQTLQVPAVEIRYAEEAFVTDAQLYFVRLSPQILVVLVEPRQEIRVVAIDD